MPNRFDRSFARLNEASQNRVLEVLQDFEDGRISQRRLELMVAAAVSASKAQATAFGDVAMAVALGTQPLGIPNNVKDPSRWARATRTLLEADPDTVENMRESRQLRFARMARAEAATQVQDTMQVSMRANNVERWVRRTDRDPCPLCTQLADGVSRPVTVRMARHTGCACSQQPAGSSSAWGNTGWANVNPAIKADWAA